MEQAQKEGSTHEVLRTLTRNDPFFRLVHILHRPDADNDWVYERCREVQENPWGYLDLWAREHYKSTILTFNGTIGDIINDPNGTTAIFSFNRPIAKAFLRQIKYELETNESLKELFPEILYQNPKKESPKWSEDEGITVKRTSNSKEATVEAWGLVDGQPTSKHFKYRRYDDVVTKDTVSTPEMIAKTNDSIRLSYNLGTVDGKQGFVGTRYHYADTYQMLIDNQTAILRLYTATENGKLDGKPVLWPEEILAKKVRDQGPYVSACQLFNDPVQQDAQGFREEWLRFWNADRFNGLNVYILVDPASEKKRGSDYSVFWVVGLGADRNLYVLRIIRDRLNLVERANILFKLHQDYTPVAVGYEKYGLQADIEHMKDRMTRDNYRFPIIELGGQTPKPDRIRKLLPLFNQGRIFLPNTAPYTQYDKTPVDLVKIFIQDEYKAFPFTAHDDMLDSLARVLEEDLCAVYPRGDRHDPMNSMRSREQKYDPLDHGL